VQVCVLSVVVVVVYLMHGWITFLLLNQLEHKQDVLLTLMVTPPGPGEPEPVGPCVEDELNMIRYLNHNIIHYILYFNQVLKRKIKCSQYDMVPP